MKSLAVLTIAFLSSSFSAPPREIKLQYLFKRGDVFEWSQSASQKVSQTIAGISQNTELTFNGVMKLKVLEIVPSGDASKLNTRSSTRACGCR